MTIGCSERSRLDHDTETIFGFRAQPGRGTLEEFRQQGRVEGAPLVPGQEHEIVVEQSGRSVRVVVDDRLLWEREGMLHGTVSLHPQFGSTLWVREIVVRGRPVPGVEVRGPSVPGL